MPEMEPTRRNFLRGVGLLSGMAGLGVVASACAPRPEPDTVTWSMWSSSPAEQDVWDDFSAHIEAEMGRRSIADLTPSGGYPTRMDLQLVSGSQSMVHGVNGWLLPTYAGRGALLPLDDLINDDPEFDHDDFYPAIRRISSFDDRTYGVGFDVAPTVLYYNKTLFEQSGVDTPHPTEPMTWEEFRDLAEFFTEPPDQYGFACTPSLDDLVSWLYCAGGNVMDEEQAHSTLHVEASMYALEFMVGLFTENAVTPPISNLVATNALAEFLDGNVAMMQNGPWQVLNVRGAEFEWDVAPFPAGPVGSTPRLSGSAFAIPTATSDIPLAWELLKNLTSTQALDIYAQAGRNNPSRQSSSSAFSPPPENLGIVQRILAGEIAGGHEYDVTTNWNEVRNLLGQELPLAFLGQRTATEVVEAVRPRLDVLMTQNTDNIRQVRSREQY